MKPSDINAQYRSPYDMDQLADFIRRCGLNFKIHNELLS